MWSVGSVFFSLFLVFLFPILMGTLYVIMFRANPFGGLMKDWDELDEAIDIALKQKASNGPGNRREDPDDYWEHENGDVNADAGPTIRHPKNRNRAI
jgi:hypothetical protein